MKKWKASSVSENRGYTLIETVVAQALLMTVLVPLGGALGLLVAEHRVEARIRALHLAERVMEQTLAQGAYRDTTRWSTRKRWRIERTAECQARLVELRVAVYRKGHEAPLVMLRTARLLYEAPVGSPSWR